MGRPPCCEKAGLKKGPWSPEEDLLLVSYVQEHGPGNWRAVPCSTGTTLCSEFVLFLSRLDGWCHGGCFMSAIPSLVPAAALVHGRLHCLGLMRCSKSCRLRWTNYLRPDIKRGKFTLQEEQTIIQLHALLGNR